MVAAILACHPNPKPSVRRKIGAILSNIAECGFATQHGPNHNNVYRLPALIPPASVPAASDAIVVGIGARIFADEVQAQTLATLSATPGSRFSAVPEDSVPTP